MEKEVRCSKSRGRRSAVGYRALRFCRHPGCVALVSGAGRYCETHKADEQEAKRRLDERRGSARARGYTSRWNKYSKWFLSLPQNQFCKLHLDAGCAVVAQCVDHIDPPEGPSDAKFWDKTNHQAACIHCNSVKGNRRYVKLW